VATGNEDAITLTTYQTRPGHSAAVSLGITANLQE